MRLSVLKDDRGYSRLAKRAAVAFLNGREMSRVQTADEEVGYMDQIYQNKNGDYVVRGGDLVIERLFGDVQIRLNRRR